MREAELREVCTCAHCGKKIGETGLPLFYRVTIERHGIDLKAVQRQQGLTMMLGGNAAIAQAMGADEHLTIRLVDPFTVTVCEPCSQLDVPLMRYLEFTEQAIERR